MADEQEAAEQTAEGEAPKKKLNMKSILMIAGCAVGQAVIIFIVLFIVKSANTTPSPVQAAEVVGAPDMVEMPVIPNDPDAKIRAVNARSGELVYWQLKIYLQVPEGQADYVKKRLAANENYVKQEIQTIVGACNPVLLQQEADHATLKRQIHHALNKVLGKGSINEVLISECIPQKAD